MKAKEKKPDSKSIEAYGVKGMASKSWRKTFKSIDAMWEWCEKNDAEMYGFRTLEGEVS